MKKSHIIQVDPSITNDCSNFLDVVHMNSTKAVISYTIKAPVTPRKPVPVAPQTTVKKIVLKDLGPATVEANKPVNVDQTECQQCGLLVKIHLPQLWLSSTGSDSKASHTKAGT